MRPPRRKPPIPPHLRQRHRRAHGRKQMSMKPRIKPRFTHGKPVLPGFDGRSMFPSRRLLARQARGFPIRAFHPDVGDE